MHHVVRLVPPDLPQHELGTDHGRRHEQPVLRPLPQVPVTDLVDGHRLQDQSRCTGRVHAYPVLTVRLVEQAADRLHTGRDHPRLTWVGRRHPLSRGPAFQCRGVLVEPLDERLPPHPFLREVHAYLAYRPARHPELCPPAQFTLYRVGLVQYDEVPARHPARTVGLGQEVRRVEDGRVTGDRLLLGLLVGAVPLAGAQPADPAAAVVGSHPVPATHGRIVDAALQYGGVEVTDELVLQVFAVTHVQPSVSPRATNEFPDQGLAAACRCVDDDHRDAVVVRVHDLLHRVMLVPSDGGEPWGERLPPRQFTPPCEAVHYSAQRGRRCDCMRVNVPSACAGGDHTPMASGAWHMARMVSGPYHRLTTT